MHTQYPQVQLKGVKSFSHPWIFQKQIAKNPTGDKPKNGSVVDLSDSEGTWIGRGLYNGHARIALRLLTADPKQAIDIEFFRERLQAAAHLRQNILKLDAVTEAYRLVHGEADGLSGLVIDRFGELLVLQFFSAGMYRLRPLIVQALQEIVPHKYLYWFAEDHVQRQESIDIRSPASPPKIVVNEHGLKFQVHAAVGHKTGFFADQRDNRKMFGELVGNLSAVSPNPRVLDICCNSGGFGVYAKARGNAGEVVGLDLDPEILAVAKENAYLNQMKMRLVQTDLFPWLREAAAQKDFYDAVVLDPAKQTRTKEELPDALRKYCDMNRIALQVVKPGGLFVTCSCSGLVAEASFIESVRRAAFQAGRELQVIQVSGAGGDHPFSIQAQEGRYLKALWARVL